MKDIKSLLMVAAFVVTAMGAVGCTADGPIKTGAWRAPTFTKNSQNVNWSRPISPAGSGIHAETATSETHKRVVHTQNVHSADDVQADTVLVTLGLNDSFRDMVDQAPGVVLVDFYADWCGPCREQGSILQAMEPSAIQNRASIVKVNVDQHPQLASQFNVSSLPTLMLMRDGKVIDRQTGLANREQVATLLER